MGGATARPAWQGGRCPPLHPPSKTYWPDDRTHVICGRSLYLRHIFDISVQSKEISKVHLTESLNCIIYMINKPFSSEKLLL